MKISLTEAPAFEAPVFTAETNPLKREMAKSDSFSIFGQKVKKNQVLDILKALSGGAGQDSDQSAGMGDFAAARGIGASAPTYDPRKYYGNLFSMYGGRKVRGGLLGE